MRRILIFIFILTFKAAYAQEGYVPKPLPAHLQSCVDNAVRDLALSDGSREAVEALFKKHVYREGLGRMAWGSAWRGEGRRWKDMAIKLYIDSLMLAAKDAKAGALVVSTESRLADYPERGANEGNGTWQVAFSVKLSDNRIVSAGALINDNCKVLDLIHLKWISGTVPRDRVDLELRG